MRVYHSVGLARSPAFILSGLLIACYWAIGLFWLGGIVPICLVTFFSGLALWGVIHMWFPAAVAIGEDRMGVRTAGRWYWLTREEAQQLAQRYGWPPALPGVWVGFQRNWQPSPPGHPARRWRLLGGLWLPTKPQPQPMPTPADVVHLGASVFPEYDEMVTLLTVFFTSEANPFAATSLGTPGTPC
jgi:hypothetical protein